MILLLAKDDLAVTEEFVIDWLHYLDGKYFRLNGEDFDHSTTSFNFDLSNSNQNITFKVSEKQVNFNEINIVWYRRTYGYKKYNLIDSPNKDALHQILYPSQNKISINEARQLRDINKYISDEMRATFRSLRGLIPKTKWLSNPDKINFSKIDQLLVAKNCNIDIPATTITNKKVEIQKFKLAYENIICKSVYETKAIRSIKGVFAIYTEEIYDDDIEAMDETIFPILIQEKLEKEYELRIFYLDKKMYAMAIFSQNNKTTSTDFRKYDKETPNRTVPYSLSTKLERKIIKLMDELKLKTGSLDFVKTIDNRYVFLEVNPVGQLGMVSGPCNYFLEKEIAEYLIKEDLK